LLQASIGNLSNSNPPTPAFAKAGAAPGTTGGVELGSFVACHGNNGIPTPQAKFVELGSFVACHGNTGTPNPAGKGTKAHINSFLLAFKPAVCQASNPPNPPNAFLVPPTPQAKAPRLINSFFLAFKPAVCQASNAPNPPNAFLAPPTPQTKAPRPSQ